MAVLATDNFNRADASDNGMGNGTWVVLGPESLWKIVSNEARPTALATEDSMACLLVTWPDDQYAQARLTTITGTMDTAGVGCAVRADTGVGVRTYYRAFANSASTNNTCLVKVVADVVTVLGQTTVGWSAGDVLRLEVEGTALRVKRNGVTVQAISDGAIASGYAGITYSATMTAAALDDWEGGSIDPQEQSGTELTLTGMEPKMGAV